MTRKDYELIARVFFDQLDSLSPAFVGDGSAAIKGTARNMAQALAKANPAFDRVRFLKACGIDT